MSPQKQPNPPHDVSDGSRARRSSFRAILRHLPLHVGAVAAALSLLHPRIAAAQNSSAAAEALFDDARTAMAAKRFDVACAKFRESDRLDPAVGTRFNLANCEEQRGHLATAWALYHQVLERLSPDDPRAPVARERSEALKARIPRLTIRAPGDLPGGTTLNVAGLVLQPASFGSPVPLDPGSYKLFVGTPGKSSREFAVTLLEGHAVDFEIPEDLDDRSGSLNGNQHSASPSAANPSSDTVAPRPWRALEWGGVGAASAGVLALSFGGYFLATALGKKSDSSKDCSGDLCGTQGFSDRSTAVKNGNTATIFGIAGGLLVAGGATLFIVGRTRATDGEALSADGGIALTAGPAGLSARFSAHF